MTIIKNKFTKSLLVSSLFIAIISTFFGCSMQDIVQFNSTKNSIDASSTTNKDTENVISITSPTGGNSNTTNSSTKSSNKVEPSKSQPSNNSSSAAVKPITSEKVDKPNDLSSQKVVNSEEELYSLVEANLELGNDTTATLKGFAINNIGDFAIKISSDNGYGGYISSVEYSINNNNLYIHFKFKEGRDTFLLKTAEVKAKVQSIVNSVIKSNMTDFQKELALHNYIVNNTAYDQANLNKGTLPDDSFTAYGVFFKKVAVCEGYAEAMYRLLNEAGVKSLIIIGQGNNVPHAWNLVNIGGKYYHLDTTFDDPVSTSGNLLSYNYFNLTDKEIAKDHSWTTTSYPQCTSTDANYFVANKLVASNSKELYNIIYNGLINKQTTIRCKTSSYNTTTFSADTLNQVLKDNPKINYLDSSRGFSYSYDPNTCVMELYIKYR